MFDVLGWLEWLVDSFFNLVKKGFDAIQEIFQDFFFYIVRLVLDFGLYILDLIDSFFPNYDLNSFWLSVGSDFLNVLGYLQFHTAIGIVVSAFVIRMIINLIPFIG